MAAPNHASLENLLNSTRRESFDSKDNTPGCDAYTKKRFGGTYEQLAQPRIKLLPQLPTKGPSVSPMSWRITRSAMSSCSVGSRLTTTRRAPDSFAIIGKPAAGHTTSEEPIAIKRSQACDNAVARCISSSGIIWPKEIVAVFTGSSHTVQLGAAPSSSKRRFTQSSG